MNINSDPNRFKKNNKIANIKTKMIKLPQVFIFRILAILTLGSIFLPIVFRKLGSPFHTPTFYLVVWIIFILYSYPRLMFSKSLVYIYMSATILSIGILTIWKDRTIDDVSTISLLWGIKELLWLFLSILMYSYFIKAKDYKGLAWVVLISLMFMVITSITSIIGINNYPESMRGSTNNVNQISAVDYQSLGIGNFGFFIALALSFPVFVFFIKNNAIAIKIKVIIVAVLSIFYITIVRSSYATTLLTATFFFIIALLVRKKLSGIAITIIVFVVLAFFVFKGVTVDIIKNSAYLIENTTLQKRLLDFSKMIELSDYDPNEGKTYAATERLSRSMISMNSFFRNPIIGDGKSAGHAYWLDLLAEFGILGFFPWILIFRDQIRLNTATLKGSFLVYYQITILSLILFGLFKNGLNAQQPMMYIFFILPGMYFLLYLKKVNPSRNDKVMRNHHSTLLIENR